MTWPDRPWNLPIRLELAFGADPAAEPSTWAWTDVSTDVAPQTINVSRGRPDESGQVQPARATIELTNNAGDYTPGHPAGAHYPYVREGVPARLSVQAGGPYLRVPDLAGARARVASTTAMDVSGDLDLRIEVALDRLPAQRPAGHASAFQPAAQELMARYNVSGAARMWLLFLDESGAARLRWSPDGAATLERAATTTVPYVSGQRFALRATLDVDNGSSGHTVTFWTAASLGGPWRRLGEPIVTAGTTSIHTGGTADLEVGEVWGTTNALGAGRWYGAEVRAGIDGPLVAAPDFTVLAPGDTAFVDAAGRSWLIEGGSEVTDWRVRLVGTVDEWAPTWPFKDLSSGNYVGEARTGSVINGILRRLGQGQPALESTLRRRVPSFNPLAYWPMEEGRDATQAYSPVEGVAPMETAGLSWASDDTLPGSSALPTLAEGANWNGRVPAPLTSQTEWMVEFVYRMDEPPSDSNRSLFWIAGSGTIRQWRILYGPPSGGFAATCLVTGEDADGSTVVSSLIGLGSNVLGTWLRQQFRARQNGSAVDWTIRWTNVGGDAGVFAGSYTGTVGRVRAVSSPPGYHSALAGVALGHVAVFSPWQVAAFDGADTGWAGETAVERMRRLAQEEQLQLAVLGVPAETTTLGPQRPATLLTLLQEAADADGGLLFERRDTLGLQYRPRHALYSQQTRLALAARSNEIDEPFTPILDDQRLRNQIIVTRTGGSSAAAVDAESVATRGRYEDNITLNVAEDGQLEPIAYWLLHRGTWPGMRYPAVTTSLDLAPQTITDWLEATEGDRAQVSALPPQHPTDAVDLMVEGLTETVTSTRWSMEAATSPAGPWTVGEVAEDDPGADDAPVHVDTDGSELVAAIDATTTEVIVLTTAGPEWATSAGPSPTAAVDDLPFDVEVGGEIMTATDVQPLVWDTFARSTADGWGATPSTISLSWLTAGGTAADRDVTGTAGTVALPDTAIRFQFVNAGLTDAEVRTAITVPALATGGSLRAGIVMRISGASYYQLRVNFTTSGAVGLDVVNSGTVIASISSIGRPYTAGSRWRIRARVVGQTITGRVWLDGTPEPGWQITTTVTTGTIASGLPGVTASRASGNTNVNPVMAFDDFAVITPQRFGVVRSVNGVVKSHAAGDDVQLANPMIIAL
ncbi:hypothetical protein ACTWP5_27550 [Streptomyces sp. 4N509B]|uniref:hypothetical protein n=1 Tax=Streptomyces sp. 4N509B TaxID=3457413 RepID=UPI003FD1570E